MARLAQVRNYLFYLIPFISILVSIAPQEASNPWMAFPFFLLSIYLLLSGRLSNLQLRDPVLLCLLLLWLGWTWGAIFSTVPFASQVTLLILSILPISYLCAINRNIKPLLYAICAIVTALATAAIYQMLFMTEHHWRARLFFDDENILAAFIAFVIPLMISFYFSATKIKWKLAIYLGLGLLLGGLILTQSRSAFLGCAIGIIPVFIKNKHILSRKSLKIAIPFAVLFITGLFATSFGHRLILAVQMDKDVLGRLALWKSALQMAWENPVYGVGLGIFHLYYPPYKTVTDNSSGFWVHMDPLQWAVESGWATLLAFYALTACIFFKYIRKNLTQLQIGAGASLLTIFVTAHAGYVFHYVPIVILTGLLLAQFGKTELELSRLRFIPAISLTLVVLCGLWTLTQVTPTLYFWTKAADAYNKKDLKEFTENIEKCLTHGDPKFPGCRLQAARFLIETSPDPDPQALIWLSEAEKYDNVEAVISTSRAQYYQKKDPASLDIQAEHLNKALTIDPSNWMARRILVEILVQQGKYQEAYNTLEIARKYQIPGQFLEDFYKLEADLERKVKQ